MSPIATRRTPSRRLQHVVHGAGATAAAADEADPDFVAARGVRARNRPGWRPSCRPRRPADVLMKSRRDGAACLLMLAGPWRAPVEWCRPCTAGKWSDNLLSLRRIVQLGDDAEADEGRIGVPPQALRILRIPAAPRLDRRSPRRAPQLRRRIVPGSAAHGVGIELLAVVVLRIRRGRLARSSRRRTCRRSTRRRCRGCRTGPTRSPSWRRRRAAVRRRCP